MYQNYVLHIKKTHDRATVGNDITLRKTLPFIGENYYNIKKDIAVYG